MTMSTKFVHLVSINQRNEFQDQQQLNLDNTLNVILLCTFGIS